MTVFIAAFVGSLMGLGTTPIHPFLWVTGSLTMGGLLRYLAIAVRKEL
jgi:hypothetical protein